MDNPAVTEAVTHVPVRDRLLAGRMAMDAAYRTERPGGTTDWLLVHTVAGRGRFSAHGVTVLTGPGEAALLSPSTPHDYGTDAATGHWTLLFAHVHPRPDWAALLAWPQDGDGIPRLRVDGPALERTEAALDRMVRVSRSGLRQSTPLAMAALEEALLWYDTANPRRGSIDSRLLAVQEAVATDLAAAHTVASLARTAGLSPSRLAHLFTAELGTSVIGYVERRRMEVARELLELTAVPVHQVARQVGYADPLYFSRRFRRAVGQSPSAFRRDRQRTASFSAAPGRPSGG